LATSLGGAPPAPKNIGKAKGKGVDRDLHLPKRPPEQAFHISPPEIAQDRIEFSTVASKERNDARRLLADFLPRAFRRPTEPEEVQRYLHLFKSRLADGDMFEVAMRRLTRPPCASPDFLFLKEPAGALDDWAVASRLSYFLWNSMPDDTLLAWPKRANSTIRLSLRSSRAPAQGPQGRALHYRFHRSMARPEGH